jgi:SAM-dependent methyltransferase
VSTLRSCRFCGSTLSLQIIDLGMTPLSNAFVHPDDAGGMEPTYPLEVFVCSACYLVQIASVQTPENIFRDYPYFSSFSDSWLAHASRFAEESITRLDLSSHSLVVEIASNDGYLLRHYSSRGIPVLGIEPALNVAEAAAEQGISTVAEFFGTALARKLRDEGRVADLLIGNNVLAHVPDLNDFVAGLAILLSRNGVLSMEFPHLVRLLAETQFDTIYHEHLSYFSLLTAERIFHAHDLEIFDVETLPTHGGSLRIYVSHRNSRDISERVDQMRNEERRFGIEDLAIYHEFTGRVHQLRWSILEFLIEARREGKRVAGYGAPAKGNTLLNYCGVRTDLIEYTVDRSPHKQGLLLPGTRIPIHPPSRIAETRPDLVFILPWNLAGEIIEQMSEVREWGGQFVIPIPRPRIVA